MLFGLLPLLLGGLGLGMKDGLMAASLQPEEQALHKQVILFLQLPNSQLLVGLPALGVDGHVLVVIASNHAAPSVVDLAQLPVQALVFSLDVFVLQDAQVQGSGVPPQLVAEGVPALLLGFEAPFPGHVLLAYGFG